MRRFFYMVLFSSSISFSCKTTGGSRSGNGLKTYSNQNSVSDTGVEIAGTSISDFLFEALNRYHEENPGDSAISMRGRTVRVIDEEYNEISCWQESVGVALPALKTSCKFKVKSHIDGTWLANFLYEAQQNMWEENHNSYIVRKRPGGGFLSQDESENSLSCFKTIVGEALPAELTLCEFVFKK